MTQGIHTHTHTQRVVTQLPPGMKQTQQYIAETSQLRWTIIINRTYKYKSSSARSLLQLRASIKSAHRQTKYIHCVANYEIAHTECIFAQAGNFIVACVIVASDCVVAHGPVTPSTSNWFIHILVNIGIQTVVESTYLKMFVLFNTELGKV